jgi:hypothetical protein
MLLLISQQLLEVKWAAIGREYHARKQRVNRIISWMLQEML